MRTVYPVEAERVVKAARAWWFDFSGEGVPIDRAHFTEAEIELHEALVAIGALTASPVVVRDDDRAPASRDPQTHQEPQP